MTRKQYLAQETGTCCFVYAVANSLIYLGLSVPDLEEVFDIACCRTGSTIHHQKVVDHMKAPLEPTMDHKLVYQRGGILNIWHPIWNGHAFFLYPTGKQEEVVIINSWLGPNVVRCGARELDQFVPKQNNIGKHWVLRRKYNQKETVDV